MIDSEILVKVYLVVASILGIFMTRIFFLKNLKRRTHYTFLGLFALTSTIISDIANIYWLSGVWPLYCLYGLSLFSVESKLQAFSSKEQFLKYISLGFSLGGAIWFIGGQLNITILGYSRLWCYLTAAHFYFIGWLFIGCFAYVSERSSSTYKTFFNLGSYFLFFLFIIVAFGIYRMPELLSFGVPGVTAVSCLLIGGNFLLSLKTKDRLVVFCAFICFVGLLISMSMAMAYEFKIRIIGYSFDILRMIWSHAMINAFIVIPALFFSILFNKKYRFAD